MSNDVEHAASCRSGKIASIDNPSARGIQHSGRGSVRCLSSISLKLATYGTTDLFLKNSENFATADFQTDWLARK